MKTDIALITAFLLVLGLVVYVLLFATPTTIVVPSFEVVTVLDHVSPRLR